MSECGDEFFELAEKTLRDLFDKAKGINEVQFVRSMCPEFRGSQDPGWCTWEETDRAFEEYLGFIKNEKQSPFKTRVVLGFYCHLSEASGFYECPKNLLRLVGGECYRMWPFLELNRSHGVMGEKIAPNANKVFKDLIGHATELGLKDLAAVFENAFDPKIRNAYSHSDYILWKDGFRIRNQACGHPEVIPWNEFEKKINRGVNFYHLIKELIKEYLSTYHEPVDFYGCIGNDGHKCWWRIGIENETGQLYIKSTNPPNKTNATDC